MAMNNWYECKVKYEKTLETGTQKKVAESYLVDAMSFTEAENRIIEEMTPFIVGEFEVAAVKKARISELFIDPEGDKWYRAKVMFITIDEKTGVEKKAASTFCLSPETSAPTANLSAIRRLQRSFSPFRLICLT